MKNNTKPIRILNVVGRMDCGGIETFIMNIYRNIDREKVQFDFIAHYGKIDADYNAEIKKLGGKIYEMPVIKTTEKTYYSKIFKYRKALKHFFKNHPEYRVLHGHMTNTAAIYMPIAKKYGNITCCIAHSHLSHAQRGLTGFITDILQKPIKQYATDYFACSKKASYWLLGEKFCLEHDIRIISNAIQAEKYIFNQDIRKKIREELNISNSTFVVGHIGRFFKVKNHKFLIKTFSHLLLEESNSLLVLIGEGNLQAEMEEYVKTLGIESKVKFLGLRNNIPELLNALDMYVMPSLHEGLPVSGIEAQASGLPCVMSTGIPKDIDITNNILFLNLNDGHKNWAQKILEYKKDFVRENTYNKIVKAGFDVKSTAKELEEFYIRKHENNC